MRRVLGEAWSKGSRLPRSDGWKVPQTEGARGRKKAKRLLFQVELNPSGSGWVAGV